MSSRVSFIKRLFDLSRDTSIGDAYMRYRKMGRQCKLADYLYDANNACSGSPISVLPDKGIGFVALNVDASFIDSAKSPIIPFFSIAIDGKKDESTLRKSVLKIAENAGSSQFLTCPDFLNEYGLEEVQFQVIVDLKNGSDSIIPQITALSAFDEDNTASLNGRTGEMLKSINEKGIENTFLFSWCRPFFHHSHELHCYVRAVDWDDNCKAHSVFVTIFNTAQEVSDWVATYGEDVMNIITIVKSIFISDIQKKQLAEAVKSAKAAIMSRNMSHNLGSHVMSYLKNHLSSVQNVLSNRVLSRLIDNESDLAVLFGKEDLEDTELTLPFLVGLGQFISYLQERQDFIATIATDYVPYYATINFKDSIYDELNNDKRFERHQDRKNLKPDNILLGNIARSEGLARRTCPTSDENSNLSDIVIKFRTTFTGDPVETICASLKKVETPRPIILDVDEQTVKKATEELKEIQAVVSGAQEKINGCSTVCSIINNVISASKKEDETEEEVTRQPKDYYGDDATVAKGELEEMRMYEVSLPGGIVGRQAVFSIFENVIRNAAKHGNWRKQRKLELTIDIFSKEDVLKSDNDNGLKERLRDDQANDNSLSLKEVLTKYYCAGENDEDDYFFVTLTDNLDVSDDSLKSLRKALIEDYINEDSIMIDANKGIKEMRISAAWLRSIINEKVLSPYNILNFDKGDRHWLSDGQKWDKRPPVLYARLSKDTAERCNLQYIFCLMRPKRVALISPSFTSTDRTRFVERGWHFFTPEEYSKCKNKSFEIIVLNDTDPSVDIMNIKLHSTKKFILLSQIEEDKRALFDKLVKTQVDLDKPISDDEIEDAVMSLYKFLSKWDESEMILINDEKAKNNYDANEKRSQYISFEPNENTKYRYVTHLESKKEFKEYVVDAGGVGSSYLFSEGITGDNSTDRLVRNEALTDGWFFRHLYAMKQKVAIFDERIFSNVYGLEENDFVLPPIDNFSKDENLEKNKEALKGIFSTPVDQKFIDGFTDYVLFDFFVKQKKYNPQTGTDLNNISCRNHLGATYAFKSLYIFTIIRSIEHPETFNIYGYQYAPETPEFSRCVKYATIGWNKDDSKLVFKKEDNVEWIKFDSLSIHQGLLDKLYGVFKIKEDDKENNQAKENLTKCLFEKFSVCGENILSCNSEQDSVEAKSQTELEEDEEEKNESNEVLVHYYLPGMTIHSGRSKPSKEDMPQCIPFIPYSAIEHAVHDCKYSIVELLDSARYE